MASKKRKKLDYWLLIPFVSLCVFGAIMVYSSSYDYYMINGKTAFMYFVRQTIYVILGWGLAYAIFRVKLDFFRRKNFLRQFLRALVVAYIYLIIFGINTNGTKGWIILGPLNVQPSQIANFFLILSLANSLADQQNFLDDGRSFWQRYNTPISRVLFFVIFTAQQHDVGSAVMNATISLIIFLASGIDYRKGVSLIFVGTFGIVFFLTTIASHISLHSSNYMVQRIVAFKHPFLLSKTTGNQLISSYYALVNGGIFGQGLGNSIQKLGYLPESNTDFILSVIGEELGLIMIVIVLVTIMVIVLRIVWIGIKSQSLYNSLVCYGVATLLTISTLFNAGGISGLLPITGMALPFISYGGSSLLVLSACMGLVLNISAQERMVQK